MPATLLPLVFLASSAAPPAPQAPLVGVAVIKSADDLQATASCLAANLGQPELAKQLTTTLGPLQGLDRTSPLGVYVRWPVSKDYPGLNDLVAFAPVPDQKALLDSCKARGWKVATLPSGLVRLDVSAFLRLTLRFAHGRAYAGLSQGSLRTLPDPAELALPLGERSVFLARVWPERAQRPVREAVARSFVPRMAEQFKGEDWERLDPTIRAAIPLLLSFSSAGAAHLVSQYREVTLELTRDRKGDDLGLDLSVVPQPRSGPAELAAYLGGARSRFFTVPQGTPLALLATLPPSANWGEGALLAGLSAGLRQAVPPRFHGPLQQLGLALRPTLSTDGLDTAFLLYPDGFVASMKLREGRKLDRVLRDAYRDLTTEDRKALPFRLNQDRIGDARVHRLKVDADPLLVACSDDWVVVATDDTPGRGRLAEAVTAKRAPAARPGPFARLELTADLLLPSEEEARKEFHKRAPGIDPARARARLWLEGGSAFRLRAQLHPSVLAALDLYWESE